MSHPMTMPQGHQLPVPVHFCRHAESTYNAHGDSAPDVPLSESGREQAAVLTGHYSLVLCSPMQRARQTLELSSITYDELRVMPELREVVSVSSDRLPREPVWRESGDEARQRCARVHQTLLDETAALAGKGRKAQILLVSHCVFGGRLYAFCNGSLAPRCPKLRNAVIVPFPVGWPKSHSDT